jgi:hypothetical protein
MENTMKHFAYTIVLATAALALPALAATEVKGVKFPDTYQTAGQTLQLNGAGVRVKVIVDVYAAGLYVVKPGTSASTVIDQSGPKSMEIVLLRDLTGEDFADATVKGFKANNSAADQAKFQAKLDEIKTMMVNFGAVKKGTVIHIDFVPGEGTHVLVDGKRRGPEITGDEFQQAVLRIWLGNKPVDEDLKHSLLGGK